jgi:hypothetical protein
VNVDDDIRVHCGSSGAAGRAARRNARLRPVVAAQDMIVKKADPSSR